MEINSFLQLNGLAVRLNIIFLLYISFFMIDCFDESTFYENNFIKKSCLCKKEAFIKQNLDLAYKNDA